MPRQGKQLNIWISDEVMASLEEWIKEKGTTKTDGVVQAIQLLTGTHPEAPPDLRSQVTELAAEVRRLHERIDQLEEKSQKDLHKLSQEVKEILKELGTTLEEATLEHLRQIAKALRIRVSRSATQEQLRQRIRSWPGR